MKIREELVFYFGVLGDGILFAYRSTLGVFLAPLPVLTIEVTLFLLRMASPSKAHEGTSTSPAAG